MLSTLRICHFNDCNNPALGNSVKCSFHRNRRQCIVDQCTNQVYARRLCVRHGGKKQCEYENCENHARGGGYCIQHGGHVVKRFCIVEGCKKQAHARQRCVRHGGGRQCRVDGCTQHARAGNLCNRHSNGHECSIEGCRKTAQHMSTICFRHAMELRARGESVPNLFGLKSRTSPRKRPTILKETMKTQDLTKSYLPSPIAYNGSMGNTSSNIFDLFPSNNLQSSPRLWSPINNINLNMETNVSSLPSSTALSSFALRPTLSNASTKECKYMSPRTHVPHENEDLESVLASYSKLMYPLSGEPFMSPKQSFSRDENCMQDNNGYSTGPPSLVRMNSLLPPAPGMVMGSVPLLASFAFKGIGNRKNEDGYMGFDYFMNDLRSIKAD